MSEGLFPLHLLLLIIFLVITFYFLTRKKPKILYSSILLITLTLVSGCQKNITQQGQENITENNQQTNDSQKSNTENSQQIDDSSFLTGLTLDNQEQKDDSIEIITPSGSPNNEKITIKVILGNKKTLEKTYEGNWLGTVYTSDLLSDGTEEIILSLRNRTSNYASSEVHVLKVKNNLEEILTIVDDPESLTYDNADTYKDSLLLIPWPKDNFGLPEEYAQEYASVCTGGMPIDIVVNGESKKGLKISHWNGMPQSNIYYSVNGKEAYPYSIIIWNGKEWTVAEQGVENNWFIENID